MILVVLLVALLYSTFSAQTKTVTGRIVAEDFQILEGAVIQTTDTIYTTRADKHGNFEIEVPEPTNELVAWHVGMETGIIPLRRNCPVNIILLNHMIIEHETIEQAEMHEKQKKRNIKPLYKKAYKEGVFEKKKPCS